MKLFAYIFFFLIAITFFAMFIKAAFNIYKTDGFKESIKWVASFLLGITIAAAICIFFYLIKYND